MPLGPVTWKSDGGNVNASGVFRSNALGQAIKVTASSGTVSGSATVNIIQTQLDSAYAWPVPFKPALGHTIIHFSNLAVGSTIKIFTITGEMVKQIDTDTDVTWDVKNLDGDNVASGVYIYQIKTPTARKKGKLSL